MHAAIAVSIGGTIWAPSARYTLYPLSPGGLWLAVTITPAQAPASTTEKAMTGVGNGRSNRCTAIPCPAKTAAESSAKTSD